MENGISLISTYVDDIFISHDNKVLSVDQAGPLYYLDQSIDKNIPKHLFYGEKITINLFLTKDGQPDESKHRGVVKDPIISKLALTSNLSNWSIVSTVFDEWNLSPFRQYKGKLCIDIQGYVRKYPYMSVKKNLNKFKEIFSSAYCIKGTRKEISFVPQDIIRNVQKKGIVLITDENNSITIIDNDKSTKVDPPLIQNVKISKGSGDILFGHYVSCLYKGVDSIESAKIAAYNTSLFLEKINR